MGIVYEAFDRERSTPVALKMLSRVEPEDLYRFKNEFRALADLHHPNLIRLGELFCEEQHWFFTMDLIDGVDFIAYVRRPEGQALAGEGHDTVRGPELKQLLAARAYPFDEPRLRSALAQLALGVCALHDAGKIHRDVKPTNVLVTPQGKTVLLDFGLIVDTNRGERQVSGDYAVGTPAYMAPEQAMNRPVAPPADWYAVGTILYQALTGRLPFDGEALELLIEKQRAAPPPVRSWAPNLPADLASLCDDLLLLDPAARPAGHQVLARLKIDRRAPEVGTAVLAARTSAPASAFVGRTAELETIARAESEVGRNHAVVLFVSGESGVGKSALVRHFLDQSMSRRDDLVLAGRCYERELVPFKAFDGIVDALSRELGNLDPVDAALLLPEDTALLARVFPVLRRANAVARAPEPRYEVSSPQEVRTRAFLALRRLLARLSDRSRIALFIDDFQWADADSLALLAEVMHPPDPPPLLLVATIRRAAADQAQTEAQKALPAIVAGLGDVRQLDLLPLPPADARTLAELLMGQGAGADAVANEAGGHPLFIQELARHARAPGTAAPASVRLDQALWTRISGLDPAARTLVEVVALAGIPFPQRIAMAAAELPQEERFRCVTLLRDTNIVRTSGTRETDAIEPYHDRIREAVLLHLDETTRRRLHGRLADALEQEDASAVDPQVVVRHLEAAGEFERAARQAEHAAGRAAELLAFDQAAELYGTALRLGHYDAESTRRLQMLHAEALVNASRNAEAAELFLAAAEGADDATRLGGLRRAAEQFLTSGHIERGLQVLGVVLEEVGLRSPTTSRAVLASLLWQRARLRLRGIRRWKRREESEILPRDLVLLDIYRVAGVGLSNIDSIRGADFQARGLLLSLRMGEPRRIAASLATEATYLAAQGPRTFGRARRMGAAAERLCQQVDDPYAAAWVTMARGAFAFFEGRFDEAAELIAAADPVFQRATGFTWVRSTARIGQLWTLRQLGTMRELRRLFDEYVRDAVRRGDHYSETTIRRSINLVWLVDDLPDEARRDLARVTWVAPPGDYHLQHWHQHMAESELALYEGQAGDTRERWRAGFAALRRSLLPRILFVRAESTWLHGRLLLAQARAGIDRDAALAQAHRIARKLEREQVPYARIWSGLVAAGALAQQGETAASVARLRATIELADATRTVLWAAAARWRLGNLLGNSEGDALLERAKAWMDAEGVKNPTRLLEVVAPGFGERPLQPATPS